MVFVPAEERPPGGLCSPWATVDDVCDPGDIDTELLDTWLDVASSNLFELTGRRWTGECTDTWYPTGADCFERMRTPIYGRTHADRIRLPGYPVVEVEQVVIDGEAVSDERYRIEDSRWLVWIPDEDTPGAVRSWPRVEGWYITYVYGTLPPPGGREAAAALGQQLALSCSPTGDGECRLPERVTSITRQGLTMAILDPLTLFSEGRTGLVEVDMWIEAQRLGVARRPAGLVVPGRKPAGHRRDTLPPSVPLADVILYGGDSST